MRQAVVGLVVAALLALPACQMNERLSGTVMGGTGGAVLGGVLAESFAGALVGGGVGALAGYLIGDYLADQRERGCCAPAATSAPCSVPTCAPASGSATDALPPARAAAVEAWRRGRGAATLQEARAGFEESVRADPTFAPGWNALGLSAWHGGDAADAERYFEQAVRVDPTYDPGVKNLAYVRGR